MDRSVSPEKLLLDGVKGTSAMPLNLAVNHPQIASARYETMMPSTVKGANSSSRFNSSSTQQFAAHQ